MIERLQSLLPSVPGGDALSLEPMAGGYSNRTDLLRWGAERYVLRRPPTSVAPDRAHDVLREAGIVAALATTPVPVPRIVARSAADDEPFYVATFVSGDVLRGPEDARVLSLDDRHAIGMAVADMLATIHAVDAGAVGITTRSQRSYVERQLDLWYHQIEDSASVELRLLLGEIHDELVRTRPAQTEEVVTHGDYHLGNIVLDHTHVAAVLDWELATAGDPLADLGLALAYWTEPGDEHRFPAAATDVAGFPTREELVERYQETSGRSVRDLAYFLAFAHWKIACIAEAVHARVIAGVTPAGRSGIDLVRSHPGARARAAARALEQWGASAHRVGVRNRG